MKLIDATIENLSQLYSLVDSFEINTLTTKFSVLQGSTIGQHLRHVIEFYTCLLNSDGKDFCYDKRERKLALETSTSAIKIEISAIINKIKNITEDVDLSLYMSFDQDKAEFSTFKTSLYRELIYCLEHTVHHSAILKIAIKQHGLEVDLPENFGVAYATTRNQKLCAQ